MIASSLTRTLAIISLPAFFPILNKSIAGEEAMRLNPTKVKITAIKKIENFVLNLIYISFIIIFQSHLYIRKKQKKVASFLIRFFIGRLLLIIRISKLISTINNVLVTDGYLLRRIKEN